MRPEPAAQRYLSCAPAACTLPAAERPRRLAEFSDLVATALVQQVRTATTQLRWTIRPGDLDRVRDLTARESACCSFFTFSIRPSDAAVVVDIDVPPAHSEVLDALYALAKSAVEEAL